MDWLQKRISEQQDAQEDLIKKSFYGDDLQKGAAAQIGEIRTWNGKKYKKQGNGKWMEVSDSGKTKKEHEGEKKNNQKIEENQGNEVSDRRKAQDEQNKHHEAASKLSDKEYSDEEVGSREKPVIHSKLGPGVKVRVGDTYRHYKVDRVVGNLFSIKKESNNTQNTTEYYVFDMNKEPLLGGAREMSTSPIYIKEWMENKANK